jgi:hypothetical protein
VGESERTSEIEAGKFEGIYRSLTGLIIYPAIELEEVLEVVSQDLCFPSGLTRFIISPRALRINYPISRLRSKKSLDEKQAELEMWIQDRLRSRRIRYYAESTFSFDD